MMLAEIRNRLTAGGNLIEVLSNLGLDSSDLTEQFVDELEDLVHDVFDMQLDARQLHEVAGWSWEAESRIGVSETFHSVLMRTIDSAETIPQSIASSKS